MVYSQKDKLHVVMIVRDLQIEGELHVLSGTRLTDALNSKGRDFFPVTGATVRLVGSEDILYTKPYMAVNRASIDCIIEVDEQ